MDQDTPTTGFGAASASDTGKASRTTTGPDAGVCVTCGQPIGQNRALEQFLGRIGISDEMINNLKNQMQNIDVDEYLNTARDYLKTTGEKAKTYSREHPARWPRA
jgi:hypothetical protein